jgi:hypothetical protein
LVSFSDFDDLMTTFGSTISIYYAYMYIYIYIYTILFTLIIIHLEDFVIFESKLELSSLELHWHWCVAGASSAASIAVGFSAHRIPLMMRSTWFSLEVLVWSYSQILRS